MVCFAPGGGERLTGKTGGKLGGVSRPGWGKPSCGWIFFVFSFEVFTVGWFRNSA